MDELLAGDARGTDETSDVEQQLNRLLEEETRRIQNNTEDKRRLMQDENIVLGRHGPAHMAAPREPEDVEPESAADEAEEDASAAAIASDDEPTVLASALDDLDEPAPDDAADEVDDIDELLETVVADSSPAAEERAVAIDQTVPGVIPVDPTVLRPVARQMDDEHIAVRNTRDYDHDAQSANVVTAARTGTFETIVERSSDRDVRRDPYARSSRRGDAPGEGNSRSKLRPFLAILLVALVLGGGGAVLTYGMELWGGKSVPYVIGESQANAEERLAEKGFKVHVNAEPADDAIGKVLSQSPDSGTRIPEGDKVTLVVATNRTVPEVVGMSSDEAKNVLQEAGAANSEVVTKPSSKTEGTVLAVSPEAGSAFVSRSPVVLTVATHYTVPDVVGKKESDAVDILKESTLKAEVTYIVSDKTVRTVVSTSPVAGEIIDEGGTVQVKVSSPYPTDIHHLSEFFGHSSQDVDSYLLSKGFTFERGGIDSLGNAIQTYNSTDQGSLIFSSQPYVRGLKLPSEGSSNVLSTGAPIAGVRLECPKSMVPEGYKRKALIELAKACGFKGLTDTCSNTSMNPPAGAPRITANFACGSGSMGNLYWTVLVVNGRAVATCARKDIYSSADLQPFGGSVCRFMAYQEVYLSSEYQYKEVKKTEKKSDKKDDKKDDDKGDANGDGAAENAG